MHPQYRAASVRRALLLNPQPCATKRCIRPPSPFNACLPRRPLRSDCCHHCCLNDGPRSPRRCLSASAENRSGNMELSSMAGTTAPSPEVELSHAPDFVDKHHLVDLVASANSGSRCQFRTLTRTGPSGAAPNQQESSPPYYL